MLLCRLHGRGGVPQDDDELPTHSAVTKAIVRFPRWLRQSLLHDLRRAAQGRHLLFLPAESKQHRRPARSQNGATRNQKARTENEDSFETVIAGAEELEGQALLRYFQTLDVPTVKKIFAHLEVSVPSSLKTKTEVMGCLFAALPLAVGGKVKDALKEKAQAHEAHLKAVSARLDGLRQQLAGLPVEDFASRTMAVRDVGLEGLKQMLSSLGVDCKRLNKPDLVSRLQQHLAQEHLLEQQATQHANQDPA